MVDLSQEDILQLRPHGIVRLLHNSEQSGVDHSVVPTLVRPSFLSLYQQLWDENEDDR